MIRMGWKGFWRKRAWMSSAEYIDLLLGGVPFSLADGTLAGIARNEHSFSNELSNSFRVRTCDSERNGNPLSGGHHEQTLLGEHPGYNSRAYVCGYGGACRSAGRPPAT